MIFHIAVCSPDAGLRSGLERQCMEFFARRADACIVEHLPDTDALLRKDGEGVRYDLYLLELSGSAAHYRLLPVRQRELSALLARATEPEYGPSVTVNTAEGLRALPYAGIEYLECTHHIVHFHLTSGEDVPTLSLRVPFSAVAQPLLADGRFLQPHRSYVVNLAEADLLSAGELRMRSGARISIPRGREGAVRDAFQQWVQQQKFSLK